MPQGLDLSGLPDQEDDVLAGLPDQAPEPTLGSRLSEFGQGLLHFGQSGLDLANPFPLFTTDRKKLLEVEAHKGEIARGILSPFTNYLSDIRNPNAEVNLATGLSGVNPDAIKEDYSKGNYGALAGDLLGPVGAGILLHKATKAGEAPIERAAELPKQAELPLHETEIPSSKLKPNYELVEKAKYRLGPNGPELISKPKYRLKVDELKDLPDQEVTSPETPEFEYKDGRYQKKGATEQLPVVVTGTPNEKLSVNPRLDAKLPGPLSGAKPRYRTSKLNFESDIDRASYITAQTTPSRADAAYLKFVMDNTGLSENEVRSYGRRIKADIKNLSEEDGSITVPGGNPISLFKKFVQGEEGTFDPTEVTRKIKDALTEAHEYKGYVPDPSPQVQGVVGKLFAAISDAKENSILQEEITRNERARRAGEFTKLFKGTEKSARQAMGALKGEIGKVPTQPLTLNQADTTALFRVIVDSGLRSYEQARGIEALSKILSGEGVPQRNELVLLDRIYGKGFSSVATEMYGGLGALPGDFKPITEVANVMRAAKSSMDLSAPLRQGFGAITTPEYWKAFLSMNKGLGRASWYRNVMDSIYQKDIFAPATERGESFADLAGVKLTDLEGYTTREEAFMSKLIEKIPIVGDLIKYSERAYVGFLNKLRADLFESLINDAEAQGLKPYDDLNLAKQIGGFVNNATGRGSLEGLERYAVPLNNALFSPRFMASRIKYFRPSTYTQAHPFVRQQYIRSLGGMLGAGATILGIYKLQGASVNTNSNSSDFLKAKVTDKTRVDPWGGFQQYVTAFSNTINEIKDNYMDGNKPRYGSLPASVRMIYYKLSPAAGASLRFILGRDPVTGQKTNIPNELWRGFVPMFIDDAIQVLTEDPKAIPTLPAVFYGSGGNTYEALDKDSKPFGSGGSSSNKPFGQ